MALYHKWDVKNGFTYVLQFFSLISDGLGGVTKVDVRVNDYHCIWNFGSLWFMAIPVVEFSRAGYKIRKVFD